jgi:hypothetical protein
MDALPWRGVRLIIYALSCDSKFQIYPEYVDVDDDLSRGTGFSLTIKRPLKALIKVGPARRPKGS